MLQCKCTCLRLIIIALLCYAIRQCIVCVLRQKLDDFQSATQRALTPLARCTQVECEAKIPGRVTDVLAVHGFVLQMIADDTLTPCTSETFTSTMVLSPPTAVTFTLRQSWDVAATMAKASVIDSAVLASHSGSPLGKRSPNRTPCYG